MKAAIMIPGIVAFLPFAVADQPLYAQCGGIGYTGSTVCTTGSVCTYLNAYYSQCLVGTATTTSTTTITSAASTSTTKSTPASTSSTATTTTSALPPSISSGYKILVGGYSSVLSIIFFAPNVKPPFLVSWGQIQAGTNPSWITLHPTDPSILYATQENYLGEAATFSLDSTGKPTLIASTRTGGQNPAFLTTINNGTELFVPNYNSGTIESIALTNGGRSFGTPSSTLQLVGSGPNTNRQASSHPHQAVQNGDEILVPDLGADKVWRLTKSGTTWQVAGFVQHPAGSGPRHIAILDQNLYTVHELSNTLTQHTLPTLASGVQPKLVATLSTIPAGANNATIAAGEVFISPSTSSFPTQFLYASNRGDTDPAGDTIAIFSLNPLTLVNQFRTGLQQLRGVAIGGDQGQYIVAGGMTGGGIKIFQRISGGKDLQEVASLQGVVTSPSSFVFAGIGTVVV